MIFFPHDVTHYNHSPDRTQLPPDLVLLGIARQQDTTASIVSDKLNVNELLWADAVIARDPPLATSSNTVVYARSAA